MNDYSATLTGAQQELAGHLVALTKLENTAGALFTEAGAVQAALRDEVGPTVIDSLRALDALLTPDGEARRVFDRLTAHLAAWQEREAALLDAVAGYTVTSDAALGALAAALQAREQVREAQADAALAAMAQDAPRA